MASLTWTMKLLIFISLSNWVVSWAYGQTWCNKNYMSTSPIVPPGGEFPVPVISDSPLLALRCSQTIRPYLPDDSDASFLIDTPITYSKIVGATTIDASSLNSPLDVMVSVNGETLAHGLVPTNATKQTLAFDLRSLKPQMEAFNATCTAVTGSQRFTTTFLLSYLPSPPDDIGSVTKIDMRTGVLLARPATGEDGPFEPVFPIGFYSDFEDYLVANMSVISELKEQGFTIIHPVPTFDNLTALDEILDEMQRVGLYVMYDMRWTYMNSTAVTEEVNRIKSRPNLLLWYTADEPDGTSDPLNATSTTAHLITSLDGGDGVGGAGYHPVSLVLNCQNYEFTAYASGADIILQDTYMIGNNVTFSNEWDTVCTVDYGDCGCDNCKGDFEDISTRMDEFAERIFINGWELSKAVWTVPQAFGNSSYWTRLPTGNEFLVQSIVGINHGALGVVPWNDPTTTDIKDAASQLALALPRMTLFIFDPTSIFRQVTIDRVDIGLWTTAKGGETLMLATNMNYENVTINLGDLFTTVHSAENILNSGVMIDDKAAIVSFSTVASGAWVIRS